MTARSIGKRLLERYSKMNFALADSFYWDPSSKTVYHLPPTTDKRVHSLAHEIGHATSRHERFYYDVNLVNMEREAWDTARDILEEIKPGYFDQARADKHLESYEDWLFDRSTCRRCTNSCEQNARRVYHCRYCDYRWCFALGDTSLENINLIEPLKTKAPLPKQ